MSENIPSGMIRQVAKLFIRPSGQIPVVAPERVALIKAGALGDVVMTTPLIRAIRQFWPQTKIHYIVGQWSAPVLRNNPHLDQVVAIDDRVFFGRNIFTLNATRRQIKELQCTVAFVLDRHWFAGLFAWACQVPTRIGFDRLGEGFMHSRAVSVSARRYDGEYYLDLLRECGYQGELGPLEVFPGPDDTAWAENKWQTQGLKNFPVIGLMPGGAQNPGQSATFKRWPRGQYQQLIEKLIIRYPKARLVLFGGPADTEYNQSLAAAHPDTTINLAGGSVLQSAALMKRCQLIISHDTGPMHLAAAVGTPVIAIFGPTDPERLAPRGSQHTTLFHLAARGALSYDIYGKLQSGLVEPLPCLSEITPDEVMTVIDQKYQSRLI